MKINRHSIIGGGLSALIKDHTSTTATIYCDCSNRLSISKNFYENLGIGGNSNIWGGYINYSKFLLFLRSIALLFSLRNITIEVIFLLSLMI